MTSDRDRKPIWEAGESRQGYLARLDAWRWCQPVDDPEAAVVEIEVDASAFVAQVAALTGADQLDTDPEEGQP
ncbi:MAG TPA: hypothetical protein VNQ73_16435 [Ilumatobacter sp.]|nr:hypothetical protein [Ilumatobacter sp.]